MALKRIDLEEVLLIKYKEDDFADHENLKITLMAESPTAKPRDVILEFTGTAMIYSAEIGIIVQFLKTLPGTGRTLRLVAPGNACEMLIAMNINKIPNIVLYRDLDEVQECFPGVNLKTG
jgi:anti-anti-sigma regulatory factor